jgi:flagellar hook-associated protein 3 FlgL
MRITQSETCRNFASDLETLNDFYSKISRQVSSGKRLTQLSDSPEGSADLLSLTDLATDIDQFRSSADTVSYFLGTTDSVLNEVNNLFTSVYSRGSQAASETVGDGARATIATEIRSLRDQILALANSQTKGRYLFAGSMVTVAPFVIAGDSVSYVGNSDINSIRVEEETEVKQGVSGAEAFSSVFSSIESLLSAVDSNDVSAIGTALSQFQSAFSELGQARGKIGASLNLIQNVQSRLDGQETSLKTRRSQIEDADMTEAVVQLGQAKTALDTALSAGGAILSQRNLFDILG